MVDHKSPPEQEETATFLLTSAEHSAPLWDMAPDAAAAATKRHYELIDSTVRGQSGVRSFSVEGDGVLAVFASATDAVSAAVALQRAMVVEDWPSGVAIRMRIGLHTGPRRGRSGRDHMEAAARRCARLRDVAHGGQTLLSAATASLVADSLPDGAWLVDLDVHRLRDLARPEHLYELLHRDLRQDFPPPRTLDVLPNNLPVQLTSFVGRAHELAEVEQRLREERLVTLSGAGGCGKTRLAVQAAANLADRWAGGVWWVDLGAVSDPADVVRLAATSVGALVEPVSDPLPALTAELRRRQVLLCLDTCEHVVDDAADLVETLLLSCPDLSVLATSREPLGVVGESVWRVPSLVEDEAARLFGERASLVRPGPGDIDDEDVVRAICRRVDGIPLAIELAAAWTRVLTPTQIAAGLDDRFRLLAGGSRRVIARQQTLVASMEWSHDLLAESDRVVFRRLACFTGGFTLDAVRRVCVDEDVLPTMSRLVDKSLVVVDDGGGFEARYRMLDTVRQYADERLRQAGEAAEIRDRHLDHFLALVERAEPELERDQDTWRQLLDADSDNIRAALEWGLAADDPDRGRRLAAAMSRQWLIRGRAHEGLDFLRRAIDLAPTERSPLQARLLCGSAMMGEVSGRLELAAVSASRGLELAEELDDSWVRGRCLLHAAYRPLYFDFAEAQEIAREAQRFGAEAGDPYTVDHSILVEACSLSNRDRHDEAVALVRPLYERTMARGDRFCAAFAKSIEAWAAQFTGDVRGAVVFGEEAVRIAEPAGDYLATGTSTIDLAWAMGQAGNIDGARRLTDRLVRSIEEAGPDVDVVGMAVTIGKLHLWSGDLDGAVGWFGRALRFGAPETDNWIVARALPGLASALRRLGRHEEAREYADRGVALTRALGIPHALAECLDELAYLAADDSRRAEDLHHQALTVRIERGLRTHYVVSLQAMAGLAVWAGNDAAAVRLLGACESGRNEMGYPLPAIDQPDHDTMLESLHLRVDDAAFDSAWAEGAALSLDEAVAYATRARGARARPATGWASLTPTERDVVRQVIEGLTNPEIASRLFVSRATIKTHLSHIYAKVGVSNRTELAALAKERQP